MKTILMLTDFSETANHAVSYLTSIAGQLGTEKIILYHSTHVTHPDMVMITDVLVPMPSGRYEVYKEALTELEKIKIKLEILFEQKMSVELLTDDRPVIKAVEEIVSAKNVDLVALGISGMHDQGNNSVGRIPAHLMTRHEFPLLIIPSLAPVGKVDSIMLACELKDISDRLPTVQLKAIVKTFNASFYIVNVNQNENTAAPELIKEQTDLHRLLDELQPEFHYIENKDIVAGLLEFADVHQIDLIVAVPKQRGLLERLFHESATKKIAIKATKPLLLLHKNN
ncbi:universal stress protein [Pedobacter immunditicola]|uniref:universal stress protein n=1 Tax=Pedobacter immunditicola TaxID=3133440 RepID=UPI003099D278